MSKRELAQSPVVVHGPTAKKRKDENLSSEDIVMEPVTNGDAKATGERGSKESELANAQGLVLWQTVKDAVNKEDRTLSVVFMQRPSKRQYADYYQQIQRPISLEDIKKKLDAKTYTSFEAVRQDFELCFTNAKTYNQRNSQIWKDAKHLHKLTLKEYARIAPSEDDHIDVDGEGGDQADGKKTKAHHMNRMLKARLQKLVDKTDESGRVLSEIFLDLPSKKLWPGYYLQIKRPQCIENIFKRLKRKEYITSADFAADVELVFSNAMQFNQDHSVIWEDAKTLRDYFRQLMSDLPPPFALQEYSKPSKIKLRVPAAVSTSVAVVAAPQLPSSTSITSSGGLLLRVPGGSSTQATEAKAKSAAASTTLPFQPPPTPSNVASSATTRPPTTPAQTQPAAAPPQPPLSQTLSYANTPYSLHYPNAAYVPPPVTQVTSAQASSIPNASLVNPFLNRPTQARSVTPPPRVHHPLQSMRLTTEPRGRLFELDHTDGVKSWAVRLDRGEKALTIASIRFLEVTEEDNSGEEGEDRKEEEEEDEQDEEADTPAKNGRKKGRGRARGRPKGSGTKAEKNKREPVLRRKRSVPSLEDVQVTLDGSQINVKEGGAGEWYLELPIGSHVVEVGAKGGLVWKVFAEKVND